MIDLLTLVKYVQGPGDIWATKVAQMMRDEAYIVKSNSSYYLSGLLCSSNPACCEVAHIQRSCSIFV